MASDGCEAWHLQAMLSCTVLQMLFISFVQRKPVVNIFLTWKMRA